MSLRIAKDPQAHCTLSRHFAYELEWLPETHYVAGTQVELRSGCLRSFHSWHYMKMAMENADVTWRWKVHPSVSERRQNPERVIFRARLPYGVQPGQASKIRLTVVPAFWAGINENLSLWITDVPNNFRPDEPSPAPQREEGSDCELVVVAGPVERLSVYSRPMPGPDGKVRTVLVPEDRFGNPAVCEEPVALRLEWEGKEWNEQVQRATIVFLGPPANVGRLRAAVPMASLAPSENIANGLRAVDELVVTGNPVWPDLVDGRRAAFGEFHWHTEFSGDGQRPIEDALRCARDYLNMDFTAPGDHNPRGEQWERTVAALEESDEPDQFATFFGWENGTDRGHENYYFTDPDHPLVCGGKAGIGGGHPDKLIDQLKQHRDFIAIPHHTNAVAETRKLEDDSPYWYTYQWTEPAEYVRLIEVFQCRGNQERDNYPDAWRGWHQDNHASAQDALAQGYKLGFVGGTDNHCAWPGRAYAPVEAAGRHDPKSVILTGLWAERVERQSVYDALWARHTWAVWDTRALVVFRVNDVLMGGSLAATKGDPLVAHIRLSAEDALQSLEIVSERETVWASSFSELDIDIDVPLGQAARSTHFYLRGLQRDGGILYASPVFVAVSG